MVKVDDLGKEVDWEEAVREEEDQQDGRGEEDLIKEVPNEFSILAGAETQLSDARCHNQSCKLR